MFHYPLVFFTGAAVLVLEILGTRVISPVFGSTITVWSALITVTLAALAAGYAAGGVLADGKRPTAALAAALSVSGLWILLLPLIRRPVLMAAAGFGVQGGALAAATVLFAVPLACLGAVGPLCVKLRIRRLERVGRVVGAITAVSTVGSVIGALAAGFWLVPLVSITRLLGGLALLLLACAAGVSWVARGEFAGVSRGKKLGVWAAALLAAAAGAAALASPDDEAAGLVREKARSHYGDVKVVDRPVWSRRILYIDGIPNTVADLETLDSTSDYITSFELAAFMRPGAKSALLIGLGGGSLVGRFERHYGIKTDVVEIDPVIERLARRWFRFAPEGRVYIEDGRRFLERGGAAYDLIVLDAFSGDRHPSHLFSVEALRAAKRRMTPGGVLLVNVISYAYGKKGALRRAVERTLGEVFTNVRVLAANQDLNPISSYLNLTLFASDGSLAFENDPSGGRPAVADYYAVVRGQFLEPAGSGVLVSDDYNPIDAYNAPAFAAIRRTLLTDSRAVMAY